MALIEIDVSHPTPEARSRWSIKIRPEGDKVVYEAEDLKSFKEVLRWLSKWMFNRWINLESPVEEHPTTWSRS